MNWSLAKREKAALICMPSEQSSEPEAPENCSSSLESLHSAPAGTLLSH